ncbi:fibronectin type III domain-containing protein [Streptomyces albidoflavus]
MSTPPEAVPVCDNPANGLFIVVTGNQRDDVTRSVLQRVLKWADEDRALIDYQHGGPVAFVRIPPQAIRGDHGPLKLKADGEEIDLSGALTGAVWVQPTIFDVDGVNPTTLIEYEQEVADFGAKGEPTHDTIVVRWTYDGNSQEKTEPTGWILRWRKKLPEDSCQYRWEIFHLPAWTRTVPLRGLEPDTEYEVTLQGQAQPGSTPVLTPALEPITVKTAARPAPGEEPAPAPAPDPAPAPETGARSAPTTPVASGPSAGGPSSGSGRGRKSSG